MIEIENILPSKKSMSAVDADLSINISLPSTQKTQLNDTIQDTLDVANLLEFERQTSGKYRINGVIDIISPFINIKSNIITIEDLFDYVTNTGLTSFNDFFEIYLMYPSELIKTNDIVNGIDNYFMKLKPLTNLTSQDIFPCGFNINIFNEKVSQFTFDNIEIDISNLRTICNTDRLINLPITDLYLFFNFKGQNIGGSNKYSNNIKVINSNNTITSQPVFNKLTETDLNTNGIIHSEVIFDKNNFTITTVEEYDYNITLNSIFSGTTLLNLEYLYKPTTIFNIRDYSDSIEEADITVTSGIPDYAYPEENTEIIEIFSFSNNNYPIFSGTTRLIPSDNEYQQPRKLIYDNNIERIVYYLDDSIVNGNIVDLLEISFIDQFNTETIIDLTDYKYIPESKKVIFDFINFPINTGLKFKYFIGINFVWRDILSIGFFEPGSNNGVDYPFINNNHYLFDKKIVSISPDLNDTDTSSIYSKFIFNTNILNVIVD